MKYPPIIIITLLLTGCTHQLTERQADVIAAKYGIKAPIVWVSERDNPWQDGYVIYCDLRWVASYGLSNRLGELLLHEEHHINGYDHCKNPKCLMYFSYNTHGVKKLCGKCGRKTTADWLFGR